MASASEIKKAKLLLANVVRFWALANRKRAYSDKETDPLVLTKKETDESFTAPQASPPKN